MTRINDIFYNNILITFLILLSGSILFMGFIIPTFIIGFFFVIFSILTRKNRGKKYLLLFNKTFVFFIVAIISNFLFSPSNSFGNYVTVIALSLFAMLVKLSFDLRRQDLTYSLYRVLNFIIIFSILGFALTQFVPLTSLVFEKTSYKVLTFNYLFYCNSRVNLFGLLIFRNQGCFWEPGVMSVFANFFLFLSLFKYKNQRKTLLSIICILTTFSTTGILLMVVQLFLSLKSYNVSKMKKILLLMLIIPLLMVGYDSFSKKREQSQVKNISSYGIRFFDLYSGMVIAFNNPSFGVGLNKEPFLKERNKYFPKNLSFDKNDIDDRATSNDFVKIFFSLGLFLGTYVLYLFYNQSLTDENRLVFLLVVIINLSTEPLFYTPFFLLIVFSGFQNKLKRIK